jgi:SAM-dependent methyltransferase
MAKAGSLKSLISRLRSSSDVRLPNPSAAIEVFDAPNSLKENATRIAHLRSLNLQLRGKSVLEIGCGIGHLSQFFINESCRLLSIDGRQENIEIFKKRNPEIEARLIDVEQQSLDSLGMFDVVFCYGLLYHLENPFSAIRKISRVCKELLLLETLVCDSDLPVVRIESEPIDSDQALYGVGSRPSPNYVIFALSQAGFTNIYRPIVPPEGPEYNFDPKNNLDISRNGHRLRSVFVASKKPLKNRQLCVAVG